MREDELDALLRADAGHAGEDGGFTLRLLRRLPPQRRSPVPDRRAERITQLAALCAAALAFSLVWPELLLAMQQGQGGEAGLAVLALLALIVGWTLPQTRLNPWR